MNTENFNKLFTDQFAEAKSADFKKLSSMQQGALKDPNISKAEKEKIISENNETLPAELSSKIQDFILQKRKEGKKPRQIRRMVRSRFGIMVV